MALPAVPETKPLNYGGIKRMVPGKLRNLTKETLEDLYHTQRLAQAAIAKKFGVHQGAIYYQMRRLGIRARSKTDAITLSRLSGAFTGPNNPRWNGGRHITGNGYVMVRNPQHPRASKHKGYVLEHVLVWENANRQHLPAGWDIHHMNGDKQDNRSENLHAMPSRDHKTLIRAYKQHIAHLELRIRNLERSKS